MIYTLPESGFLLIRGVGSARRPVTLPSGRRAGELRVSALVGIAPGGRNHQAGAAA
jgi:hypothetical protein